MDPNNLSNRIELIKFASSMGMRKFAEIGVARGYYSEQMCRNVPNIDLICVDPWKPSRNHRDADKLNAWLIRAKRRMNKYNAKFMVMTGMEAIKYVPDAFLDFVYIDALHNYNSVLEDITEWSRKVRKGGIVAGHDWGDVGEARNVTKAVKDYAALNGVEEIHLTLPCAEDINQSWFWIK